MLKNVKLFKALKPKGLFTINPITKSIRFNSSLNESVIKRQIVQRMLDELILYTSFEITEMQDGTKLMMGRIDVIQKENEDND